MISPRFALLLAIALASATGAADPGLNANSVVVNELLANPGPGRAFVEVRNTTGAVVDLDFMQRVVDFCREREMIVVHDFAYADLGYDGYQPPSILQAEGAKECAVELYSMTKSFSMAGWRVAFMAGNPEVIGALAKLIMPGRDPGGIIVTILLGIAGSIVGGMLFGRGDNQVGLIGSIVGALILLGLYRLIVGRRRTTL